MSSVETLIESRQTEIENQQAKTEAGIKSDLEIESQIDIAETSCRASFYPALLEKLKTKFKDLTIKEERKKHRPAHQIFTGQDIDIKGKVDPNFSLQVGWDYGKKTRESDNYPPHNEIDIHFFANSKVEVHGGHILGKTVLPKGKWENNLAVQNSSLAKAFAHPITLF